MSSLPLFLTICVVIALALWVGLSAMTYSTVARIARVKGGTRLTLRQFLRFCLMHVAGYGVMVAGMVAGVGLLLWTAKQGTPRFALGLPIALVSVVIGQACLFVGNRSLQYFANSLRR